MRACLPYQIGGRLNSDTFDQTGLDKPEDAGIQVFDQTGFPESLSDQRADTKVIVPAFLGQRTTFNWHSLGVRKSFTR